MVLGTEEVLNGVTDVSRDVVGAVRQSVIWADQDCVSYSGGIGGRGRGRGRI